MQYLDSVILKNIIKTYSNFNDYLIELFDQEENKFLPANVRNPLWMKSPKDLTDKDYIDFYNKFELNSPPLAWKHFKVEGDISYNCIIYIPKELPAGAIDNLSNIHNMKLYAKRVFIMDNNKDLLPEWCRFLFGVIDTDDLQLNVSREILQQDKMLKKISQSLTKKVIDFLHELLNNDKEKYISFYNNYSKFLKIGLYNDSKMKYRLQDLILFKHIKNPYEYISLKNYSDNLEKLRYEYLEVLNKPVENKTVENQLVENKTVENQTVENQTVENQLVENKTVENQLVENKTVENQLVENKTVENQTVENQTVDNTLVENKTVENQLVENKTVENKTVDNTLVENKTVENQTVDNTLVENKTVENQTNDTTPVKNLSEEEELKYRLIYYIYGDNLEYLLNSPNLTYAKSKGLDVLLMNDPVDEYLF
jgi:molecular chaperone HtpG